MLAVCTMGDSSEKHDGTGNEKSDVKGTNVKCGGKAKNSINAGEIDVNPACCGEKANDAADSESHDNRGNSRKLEISSDNIVKVKWTSLKLKINNKPKKNLLKADS